MTIIKFDMIKVNFFNDRNIMIDWRYNKPYTFNTYELNHSKKR